MKVQFPQMVQGFMNYVSMRSVLWISSTLFPTFITVKVLICRVAFTLGLHSWADLRLSSVRAFLCMMHPSSGGGKYGTYTCRDRQEEPGDGPGLESHPN